MRQVFLLGWVLLTLFFSGPSEAARLRVVTYNVWALPRPIYKERWRMPYIAEELPQLNADIIAIQEAFNKASAGLGFMDGYPFRVFGGKNFLYRSNSGLIIISKHKIVDTRVINFDYCYGSDCLAKKGALWARIDVPQIGEIDVFNTHTNDIGTDDIRVDQLNQVTALLQTVQKTKGRRPVIFIGDFNSNPNEPAYEHIRKVHGFRDPHEEYVAANPDLDDDTRNAYTWDGLKNVYARNTEGDLRERIDFILLKDVEDRAWKVIKTGLAMVKKIEGYPLSDHFAFFSDLEFPDLTPKSGS